MKHYYEKIQGWFEDETLYHMVVEKYDNARFVEIGCWKGRSTSLMGVEIINSGKNIVFDVVDTFQGSVEHFGVDGTALYAEFLKNIEPIRSVMGNIHVMKSLDAAKLYEDNSLKFVFIDASHQYADVLDDIRAWYSKVEVGGIIGGDDYCSGWPEVVSAVDDFFGPGKVTLTGKQHWHIVKQ